MWSVSPKAADSVHDSGGCTYEQTPRVKAAPPKTLLLHRDPAPSPPTQCQLFLSCAFAGSFGPHAPPTIPGLKGWRRRRGGGGGGRDSVLTRVSTWRVRTGLSVSGPASARHTAPLSSGGSSSSSRSSQSKGRRDMTGRGRSTGAPGRPGCSDAGDRDALPQLQARLVWAGRKERAPPPAALPPPCPHLLEGRIRSIHSLPCDPRSRILTHSLAVRSHDEGWAM